MSTSEALQQIEAFGNRYDYDMTYQRELLSFSEGAFRAFATGQPMSTYRRELPLDAHYVARIATMLHEDCGPCTQLNLEMAVEAGVSRQLLRDLLERPQSLNAVLLDVREHTESVVKGQVIEAGRIDRLRQALGDGGFAELAVCITGGRLFPTLKRALGHSHTCQRLHLEF